MSSRNEFRWRVRAIGESAVGVEIDGHVRSGE
jgi:hypothetical protein